MGSGENYKCAERLTGWAGHENGCQGDLIELTFDMDIQTGIVGVGEGPSMSMEPTD